MPVPATANGSPDVERKDKTVTTPEPQTGMHPRQSNSWREILQSGADSDRIEGVALEYLIDLQRDRMRSTGEDR
jgi:hypothetical protein